MSSPRSGHRSYQGIHADIDKSNHAAALGYYTIRATMLDLKNGDVWLRCLRELIRKLE